MYACKHMCTVLKGKEYDKGNTYLYQYVKITEKSKYAVLKIALVYINIWAQNICTVPQSKMWGTMNKHVYQLTRGYTRD